MVGLDGVFYRVADEFRATPAPDEIGRFRGWGHSDWRTCAEFASRLDAGKLWLFHHKPGRSDHALALIRDEAQKVFAATDTASEETTVDF